MDNRPSPRAGGRQSGFTLIELMLAMVILSVGVLGIVKLQMQTSTGNLVSRNQTAAVNLARSKMEELRRVKEYYINTQGGATQYPAGNPRLQNDGDNADLGNWSSPDKQETGTFDEGLNEGGRYTIAWNIADNAPEIFMKTVRVRVTWMQGSIPKYVELETQIARKNLEYYQ